MDCITIKGLEVFAKHGVFPEENTLGQKFVISVSLYTDLHGAGQTDDLEESINYACVAERIRQIAENNTFRLIERLAEVIAQKLLLEFSAADRIEVEVEKPWAPIQLPLQTVSVKISRGWHTVYLGIGSNLGDKKAHLDQALSSLSARPHTMIEKTSSFRVTKPVGDVKQDDFLNAAVCIRTLLSPEECLKWIGELEQEQKRERTIHWGPRTIDIDILLYDREIIQTPDLTIPHREMCFRQFVLEPMAEIAPYERHPVTGETMLELFRHVCQGLNS